MTFNLLKPPPLEPARQAGAPVRLHELDGLRGWAAVVVVFCHVCWDMLGHVEPAFRSWPAAYITDGQLAVSVFFVLSGEALSAAYFSGGGQRAVVGLAVKRYPRLTIPILVSCGIVAGLMALGLTYNLPASVIVQSERWLGVYLNFAPSVADWLSFSLWDVYVDFNGREAYNPPLRTMTAEMLGSILVFGLLLLLHKRSWAYFVLAFVLIALLASNGLTRFLGCFVAGMFFSAMRFNGVFARLQASNVTLWLSWIGIALLMTYNSSRHIGATSYSQVPFIAIAVVWLISVNRHAIAFFSSGVSRFLGKISFPLYLVHFPLLFSYSSGMVLWANGDGVLDRGEIALIAGSSIVLSFLAAIAFLPVEQFTTWFGRKLVSLVLGNKARAPAAV